MTGQILQETGTPRDLRQHLLARLQQSRAQTDELFSIVRPEALYNRPIAERHRIIFYLGHLEAFDWNLLGRQILGLNSFHSQFDKLFAFGIDPVDGGLPSDQPADWPSRREIDAYSTRVRQSIDECLEKTSLTDANEPLLHRGLILHVAIEHRLMHAETLAYMLHQLPLERKFPQPIQDAPAGISVAPKMIQIPPGIATLGRPRTAGEFGWDNEFETNQVAAPGFAIDAYNVTNGKFLNFINAGGYEDRSLWNEPDWEWKMKQAIIRPQFWTPHGEAWYFRNMFTQVPLPLDWPAYVSHAEASAYMRWAGKALPTEEQFHRAAYGTPGGTEREFPPTGDPLPGNGPFRDRSL